MRLPGIPYAIHDLDPFLVKFTDTIGIRWYGLSYLAGVVAAYFLLRRLSRTGRFALPPDELQNFLLLFALFGIFLGGRLGYLVFYYSWDQPLWKDLLFFFKVWEGGMSSHGGIIGCILFMLWYARTNRYPFLNLTDNIACVGPLGIAFGRLANFINGELYGRVTQVSWAMIFPQEAATQAGLPAPEAIPALLAQGRLHPRHPSQLYQAFAEGLLLFALMWGLRHTRWSKPRGRLSAVFLVGYAAARILAEFVREPDAALAFGWMTRGQLLSLFMLAAAAAVWTWSERIRQKENVA